MHARGVDRLDQRPQGGDLTLVGSAGEVTAIHKQP